jgi:mannose-6-phosphate isomerase
MPRPVFDHLLQFSAIYQPRVWGGRRLETIFGRSLPTAGPYGESWELVDRPDHQSIVDAGSWAGVTLHELWTEHRAAVFGDGGRQPDAERFPVLIKILDCRDDLSIQVHPPADVAGRHGGEPKTEMWFVAHAEAGASLYAGLKAGVTRPQFEEALRTGSVAGAVHRLHPNVGDSLFVPSGRVHALGAGLVVFEIQQNSDTTYRVFDWNRVGLDGRPRELHIEESLRSIDFADAEPALTPLGADVLADCSYFRVTRARTGHPGPRGRARIIMPTNATMWDGRRLPPGCLTMCPAVYRASDPDGEWLEIEY